MDFKVLRCFN